MGMLGTFFIIIGVWFVWKEYKHGTLKQSMISIISDYQQLVTAGVNKQEDKQRINEGFDKVKGYIRTFDTKPAENIIQNIQNANPSQAQSTSGLNNP